MQNGRQSALNVFFSTLQAEHFFAARFWNNYSHRQVIRPAFYLNSSGVNISGAVPKWECIDIHRKKFFSQDFGLCSRLLA
jgi:hypothetical protein